MEILIAAFLQTPAAKALNLSHLEAQCVVRGLDCRGAWGELIKKVEAAEASKEELDVNSIEERIREVFQDKDMIRIAKCESNLRQWNPDGSVVTGKAGERGLFQIHVRVHKTWLKDQEIDVDTLEGNLKAARVLYDTKRGKSHWSCYKTQ